MDIILQPVLESYPKLLIRQQKSPSYVEMYTKNSNDVVIVYVKNKQTSSSVSLPNKNNIETEELDLTGSPLKLDLSLHTIFDDTLISDEPQLWSKEEGSHCPLNIEKAREIANLYNKSLTTVSKDEAVPMWILTNPSSDGHPLLLTVQSDSNHFTRGIVNYLGTEPLEEIALMKMVEEYAIQEKIPAEMVNVSVDCKYLFSGISYGAHSTDELLNAPHGGATELHCVWPGKTLQTPFISCTVHFEQEVIVGHLASPCNAIWKSVCSLHNMNQMLVDMTAAGYSSINLETAVIRNYIPGTKRPNNSKRLTELLNQTEFYAYTAELPAGGCTCVTEDTTSLKQCMSAMDKLGSSNDFTYKLWDVLRDCETAEELITLLIQALKFISSGKIRPFIDANNKTYLSKLVLKLSRGHSQAAKVLKNLRTSPPQALSLVAQVGAEKTMWEYTRVMSLLEHSFYIAGIWTSESRSHESIEQINQTIQDMTMGGDFALNPFDPLSSGEHSIRLDCESFCVEESAELTVDDFASLKKHGLASERKDVNEVPLIADEIDISPWKNLLMKFAQVHVCLEHLYRAETCLRVDFDRTWESLQTHYRRFCITMYPQPPASSAPPPPSPAAGGSLNITNLKPIVSRLLEYYVSEKSPIRTVGQLMSDPLQKIVMPIANNIVQDHLKKTAFWYRADMTKKENAANMGIKRDSKVVYVFSQQPVFPPPVWQILEPSVEDAAEVTTIGEELKYYITKYTYLNNEVVAKIHLS